MFVHRCLALLMLTTASANAQRALRIDQPLTLAPRAETPNPTLLFDYTVQRAEQLSVWAECAGADLALQIDDADGVLLARDDDTGGGTTPWIRITPVRPGARYVIRVTAKSLPVAVELRLCIREQPESDASRRAFEAASDALALCRQLDRDGNRLSAVAGLKQAIEAYCADESSRECASFHRTLMEMARQSVDWLDYEGFLHASLARREAERGLYPPTSEAWSETQLAICQGAARVLTPSEALSECDTALALADDCYPPGHPNLAITRAAVSQAFDAAGDAETAYELSARALSDAERSGQLDTLRLALLRGQTASQLSELGDWNDALRLHRQAVDAIERNPVADIDVLLSLRNNLAATLSAMGAQAEALAIHEQRCAIYAKLLEPDHPEFVLARMNRAVVRLATGEAQQAADDLEEVVAAQTRTGRRATRDAEYADVALGEAWTRTGRAEQTLELLAAREAQRAVDGRVDAITDWRLVSTRVHALVALGRRAEALVAAEHALDLALRAMPPESPDLAESRQSVASLLVKLGQIDRARDLALAAARDAQSYFMRSATALTMRQAEAVQGHWSRLVSDGLSLVQATSTPATRAQADRTAFELVEGARSVGTTLLRSWRAREQTAGAAERIEPLRRAVLRSAREVARVGAEASNPQAFQAALEERGRTEAALREALSTELGESALAERVDASSIAAALADDEALIAYWRQDWRELDANATAPRVAKLLAFVVRRDGGVRSFDLGPLAPIAELVGKWRLAAASGDPDSAVAQNEAGVALRTLVVDPLAGALTNARRWRVALDDVLHLVALDALPDAEGRLGDRVELVTTPAFESAKPRARADARPARLLAIGGVDYDVGETDTPPDSAKPRRDGASTLDLSGWKREFGPLWETLDEVEDVAKVFRRTHAEDAGQAAKLVTLLSERDAVKSALIEGAPAATFLHVATHGFFALDSETNPSVRNELADRSPLTLCGLALAGANEGPDEHGFEGVITADELAALDLSHCELAVLSACDTNVGERTAGQGVASFQKALHAAGARYVITALWKVDDAASREWMSAFYTALWVDGLSPQAAAWRAKSELRRRRAPDRDWAGWTLSVQ